VSVGRCPTERKPGVGVREGIHRQGTIARARVVLERALVAGTLDLSWGGSPLPVGVSTLERTPGSVRVDHSGSRGPARWGARPVVSAALERAWRHHWGARQGSAPTHTRGVSASRLCSGEGTLSPGSVRALCPHEGDRQCSRGIAREPGGAQPELFGWELPVVAPKCRPSPPTALALQTCRLEILPGVSHWPYPPSPSPSPPWPGRVSGLGWGGGGGRGGLVRKSALCQPT